MRNKFFNKKTEFLTVEQIVEITGAKAAQGDLDKKIYDIATVKSGTKEQISFIISGQYLELLTASNIGFCLIEEKYLNRIPQNIVALVHKNPYFAYSQVIKSFYEEKLPEFHGQDLIHPTAKIGENSRIAPNAYIGKNVEIGKNCIISSNASVMDGCVIGDNNIINASTVISFAKIGSNCIIHHGAKIGQDGFGFAHDSGVNHKIMQIGIVEIGNFVEIGANSCIDRGAIENTIIKDGVKLDNLVQIAHNVIINQGTVMAGCSAIAGSSEIGRFVQIGGNSSIGGHIKIGDGAKVAGMSGVAQDVEQMAVIAGIPAIPIRKWHRVNFLLQKLLKEPKSS